MANPPKPATTIAAFLGEIKAAEERGARAALEECLAIAEEAEKLGSLIYRSPADAARDIASKIRGLRFRNPKK